MKPSVRKTGLLSLRSRIVINTVVFPEALPGISVAYIQKEEKGYQLR